MKPMLAQENMINQQIRPWNVFSPSVLDVFSKVNRADFTDTPSLANADTRLPILDGEVMLEPKIEARILQALDIKTDDYILEVGTGSGHMTALLASLGKKVDSIEINPNIIEIAEKRLASFNNIEIKQADVFEYKPMMWYDIIVFTGATTTVPADIRNTLKAGGRMLTCTPQNENITLTTLWHRIVDHKWSQEVIFESQIPLLHCHGYRKKNAFIF